jgi:rhodanese-related sulfurtransferase
MAYSIIDSSSLSELLKVESVLLVNCTKSSSTSVRSIPDSSLCSLTWNYDKLVAELARLRLQKDQEIVVYDAKGLEQAARLWWALKTIGYYRVKVLDGGLEKWASEQRSVTEAEGQRREACEMEDPSCLRGLIVSRRELLELSPESFTIIQTNALSRLEERLLTQEGTLQPLSVIQTTLKDLHLAVETSAQIIVGGKWTGTMLFVLHALGQTNCKVLDDEGTQMITKRTTVFYDVDEAELLKIDDEPPGKSGPASLEPSNLRATRAHHAMKCTRYFSMLPTDPEGTPIQPTAMKRQNTEGSFKSAPKKSQDHGYQQTCATCSVF